METGPTLGGVPHVLFTADGIGTLFTRMMRTLGRGGEAVLYAAGADTGRATHTFLRQLLGPRDADEAADAFARHFRGLGQFDMRSVAVDRGRSKVLVVLDRSVETLSLEARETGRGCHYVRGIIAGYFAEALGVEDLACDEIACASRGAPECEFVAVPHVVLSPRAPA